MAKEFYIPNKSNRCLPIIDIRPVSENDIDASYDERGNLLKLSGTQNLHWNYRDNIAYVDIITRPSGKNDSEYYVYDSSGQRVRKVTETYQNNETNSTRVEKIYFGDIEVIRTYQNNSLSKEKYTVHVMDDKSRVALQHYWTKGASDETRESQDRYQLSNHLDSVALELNDNAEIMSYEEYLPFGGTALIAGKTAREVTEKEYRYSGKEKDESTGLYYYGARYYASWLLRWINPDPAGTVDGPNLYLFVGGNPFTYIDKDGRGISLAAIFTSDPYSDFKKEFKGGDKIYGLYDPSKGTAPYISAARGSGHTNVTIDDLMKRVIDPITQISKVDYSLVPVSLQPDDEARSFLDHMKNEKKYNITRYEELAENLRDPNTGMLNSNSQEIEKMKKQLVTYSSKGGINYITSRGQGDRLSNKIHFILDDIDMSLVPGKIYSGSLRQNQGNNKYKDVTGQELRYLYRNRDNEQIMQNVIFWKGRKKVDPPWRDFGTGKVYEKTRESGGLFVQKSQLPIEYLWKKYLPKSYIDR